MHIIPCSSTWCSI